MSSATYAEPFDSEPEFALIGGEVTEGVVRVGDTVRRPAGFNAPLVHALLDRLEAAGFAGAPRFLGIDAAGREVLTFIPGEVAGRPRPAWIADEERMASVGRLVRAYDDAVAGFVLPEGVRPSQGSANSPSRRACRPRRPIRSNWSGTWTSLPTTSCSETARPSPSSTSTWPSPSPGSTRCAT
ncbi:hypothetical protein ACFQX6_13060 [Streptosporangium lutulentum]